MKFKSIKSSELDIGCWSAKRHLGECKSCQRVEACAKRSGIREAKIGLLKKLKKDLKKVEQDYKDSREKIIQKQIRLKSEINQT